MLPAIDDGAKDLEASLAMARMAVADGITVTACTPHILPGVYNNTGEPIRAATVSLQEALAEAGIPLRLATGADVHVTPELVTQLRDGRALTLNGTRYLLLEPPHHILPPRMEDHIFGLRTAGYVPIITHPERLTWIEGHYELIERLIYGGNLMQITAGSLTGRFGRRPRYWAERMLDDGFCHILATDAHNIAQRAPILSEARDLVASRLGEEEATNMVLHRPLAILHNADPGEMPALPTRIRRSTPPPKTSWTSALKRKLGAGGH
jgi:protein-tyrosine phosphatase